MPVHYQKSVEYVRNRFNITEYNAYNTYLTFKHETGVDTLSACGEYRGMTVTNIKLRHVRDIRYRYKKYGVVFVILDDNNKDYSVLNLFHFLESKKIHRMGIIHPDNIKEMCDHVQGIIDDVTYNYILNLNERVEAESKV
jgi:hypothetical protein